MKLSPPWSSHCTFHFLHHSSLPDDSVQIQTPNGACSTNTRTTNDTHQHQGMKESDVFSWVCTPWVCKAFRPEERTAWGPIHLLHRWAALAPAAMCPVEPAGVGSLVLGRARAESAEQHPLRKSACTDCKSPKLTWGSPCCSRACGRLGMGQRHRMCRE